MLYLTVSFSWLGKLLSLLLPTIQILNKFQKY
jgi:hypothetical protein